MLDDFTRTLRFKPHLLVLDAGPDTLFIVDEFARTMLSGAVYVRIAACVRERMTIAQIFTALAPAFSEWQVLAALDRLVQKGCLRTDEPDQHDLARGFFERTGVDGDAARARVAPLRVAVLAFGTPAEPLRRALSDCGIAVTDDDDARFTIAVCDSYDRAELSEAVARIAARGDAVLTVVQEGAQPTLGPLFASPAQDGPCLECVRYWTARNRPVEALLGRYHEPDSTRLPPAHSRAGLGAVAALTAAFVERLVVSDERWRHARSHLLALRLDTLATTTHRVVRRPQCPRCGNPHWMRHQAERAPRLSAAPATVHGDGGYRSADPREVFQRYQHLISPVSGAVAYLHPMPGRHAGMRKVYVAGYLTCPGAVPRSNRFDRICSGKGRTDEQARVSALCETLERFSGQYQGDEATMRASFGELAADGAIHVNALQQFSGMQFERRDAINARTDDIRKQVPQRFAPELPIDWTPAWSLATGRRHWVPLTYCYADVPARGEPFFCIHNPNGSAAGSCIEEAILQGLLELIERDAAAIWWYNQIERPAVDLAAFADPYFDTLQAEYDAMGWRLWALDITHDLRIPTIVALAECTHARADGPRFSIGFGCHTDYRIAVQRALTEVNQLLDVSADGPPPWDHARLSSTRFLYPAQSAAEPGEPASGRAADGTLGDAIAYVTGQIAAAGLDTLVVDKTRPDIGLPVVQVIVPGLCHFWPRFGAPRLYSVPVGQRWIAQARDEAELNQVLLFL
jgi:ribosomal protein S12 methylthiotransferase accessory factor